jgi:hypothetical protein
MSELDDLRSQNKELKRLLENALGLLEKSKEFLAGQAQSTPKSTRKKGSVRRSTAKTVRASLPIKKKRAKPQKS